MQEHPEATQLRVQKKHEAYLEREEQRKAQAQKIVRLIGNGNTGDSYN